MYYATTLDMGTPSQSLTVLFDAESADFWVMDSNPLRHQIQIRHPIQTQLIMAKKLNLQLIAGL